MGRSQPTPASPTHHTHHLVIALGKESRQLLTQVFRLGNPEIAEPGDSGGVVYQRSGSSGALASGLIVAGGGPIYGGYTEWHHTIPQIESEFGVTLLTSP